MLSLRRRLDRHRNSIIQTVFELHYGSYYMFLGPGLFKQRDWAALTLTFSLTSMRNSNSTLDCFSTSYELKWAHSSQPFIHLSLVSESEFRLKSILLVRQTSSTKFTESIMEKLLFKAFQSDLPYIIFTLVYWSVTLSGSLKLFFVQSLSYLLSSSSFSKWLNYETYETFHDVVWLLTAGGFSLEICTKLKWHFQMSLKQNCETTVFPTEWCYVTKNTFSPLALSHSQKHGGGCS